MSRLSIPRNYYGQAPAGECRKTCDYCGLVYMRSDMTRDASGLLRCNEHGCADGRDTNTLDRENNEALAASIAWHASRNGGRLE